MLGLCRQLTRQRHCLPMSTHHWLLSWATRCRAFVRLKKHHLRSFSGPRTRCRCAEGNWEPAGHASARSTKRCPMSEKSRRLRRRMCGRRRSSGTQTTASCRSESPRAVRAFSSPFDRLATTSAPVRCRIPTTSPVHDSDRVDWGSCWHDILWSDQLKWAKYLYTTQAQPHVLHLHAQALCVSTSCIGAAPVGCSGSDGTMPAPRAAANSSVSTLSASGASSAMSSLASSSVGDISELGRRHCALRSVRSIDTNQVTRHERRGPEPVPVNPDLLKDCPSCWLRQLSAASCGTSFRVRNMGRACVQICGTRFVPWVLRPRCTWAAAGRRPCRRAARG